MVWDYAALTDRGRRRRRNEDALLVRPECPLFAVADGMGGHAAGDVASALAISTLSACFPRAISSRIRTTTLGTRLRTAVAAAHETILRQGDTEPGQHGMGTTLTALAPVPADGACVIAHVGDSRAYRLRAGRLEQLTRDHTWVQDQVDAGILTAQQARSHPLCSVLTRVLGGRDPGPADLYVTQVAAGDLFLLCSDGLSGVVADEDMRALLGQELALPQLAGQLVAAALLRGGPDNITVVLLRPH